MDLLTPIVGYLDHEVDPHQMDKIHVLLVGVDLVGEMQLHRILMLSRRTQRLLGQV